ncbi:type II restriction endonuclease subunit R [Alkalitalea saponilacus]|nr:type II restriction endonuclease subunit R [Alkalitalea saponilacus]
MKNVEWGKYKYDKLFKLCVVKNKLTKLDLEIDGKTPVYSSDSSNNGVIGFTHKVADFLISEDNPIYIVFGDHTISFNIATESFCVMDNVKVLAVNSKLTINELLYIIASWKKSIPNKGYARHWSLAQKVLFHLPTKNGKIDFDFIESFVSEIENEQILKLENYLSDIGLWDSHLTEQEKAALEGFDNLRFKDFNITEVFEVKNTGNILSRDIISNSGETPYLCASAENNGVSSYISYDVNYIDKGDCVFIGGKTFVVSYQEKDFFSNDSHNLVLYLKEKEKKNKFNQLFFVSCINKSLAHKYSWGYSISNRKIQGDKVSLPIKDNKLDYETMKTVISAIHKLVIKDVVLYVEKKKKELNKLT